MASRSGLDEDQRSVLVVSSPDGGPRLEGSQRSSTPGDSSDLTQNRYRTSLLTPDYEA